MQNGEARQIPAGGKNQTATAAMSWQQPGPGNDGKLKREIRRCWEAGRPLIGPHKAVRQVYHEVPAPRGPLLTPKQWFGSRAGRAPRSWTPDRTRLTHTPHTRHRISNTTSR